MYLRLNTAFLQDFPEHRNHLTIIEYLSKTDVPSNQTRKTHINSTATGVYDFQGTRLSHQALVCETVTKVYLRDFFLKSPDGPKLIKRVETTAKSIHRKKDDRDLLRMFAIMKCMITKAFF